MTASWKQRGGSAWLVAGLVLPGFTRGSAEVVVRVGQNFTASTYGVDSTAFPPDCNGAAGPLHYVEFINGRFSVYRKTDGARVKTMTDLAFWRQAGVTLPNGWDVTDPHLLYDPTVQRWFAAAVDLDTTGAVNTNRFLVAVCTSADPTGAWKGVAFLSDPGGNRFADFPALGVDGNGVYVSGDLFDTISRRVGSTLVSLPKAGLLASTPVITNRTWFGVLSLATHGNILQPAVNFATPAGDARMLAVDNLGFDFNDHSNLVSFTVHNAAGPGVATLTAAVKIRVDPYRLPINPAQPNGDDSLDDGDTRLSATVYAVDGVLYAVHGTQVASRAALRWYRISLATATLLESGTIADIGLDLFYPSIAANDAGTLVIGFNGCSSTSFVSSYAMVGQTVNGRTTFGSRLLLKAGVANYEVLDSNNDNRWGDFSSTCVDPADPNRFWTIQMYPSSTDVWSTQITEVLTGDPTLSIARAGTNAVISWPGTAIPFNLESKPSLSVAQNWSLVTQPFTTNSGRISVRVPLTSGARFFRLHLP